MTKIVLFVTYNFPPIGGMGVQRVLSFCHYLPEADWEPIVLTPRNRKASIMDTSLESRIPNSQLVIQTRMLSFKKPRSKATSVPESQKADMPTKCPNQRSHVINKLKLWIHRWVYIPDDKIGWLPFAVIQGVRSIHRENVDAILTTSSPLTAHLIGFLLKKLTARPWVADFRDLWTEKYYHNPIYDSWLRLKIDRFLEWLVIKNADQIINVAVDMAMYQIGDISFLQATVDSAKRAHVVFNGFEPKIYEATQRQIPNKLTLSYTGTFYGENQIPKPFFEVLNSLIAENVIPKDRIVVRIISDDYQIVKSYIAELGLLENIECIGWMPHQQVVQEQVNASILLLFLPNNPANRTRSSGKLFEYLGAQRPILALVPPDGIAAEIIRCTQAGYVVSYDDKTAIRQTLIHLYEVYTVSGEVPYEPIQEMIQMFERRSQVLRVGKILTDSLLGQKH